MSFVLPAKAVHENQYGKGLWAKIPADGSTTVSQSVKTKKNGETTWERVDTVLSNKQLKGLVENYKTKEERGADTAGQKRSVLEDLKVKQKVLADQGWTKADEDALPFR